MGEIEIEKNLFSFIYALCSYVLKLNKWKHLLFMTLRRMGAVSFVTEIIVIITLFLDV